MGKSGKVSLIEIFIILIIILVIGVFVTKLGWNIFTNEVYTGVIKNVEDLTPMYSESGYSFSVKLDVGDKYITFSSEDRQFGSSENEDSVKVKLFKYPPWNIQKSGTYHGGRLLESYKKR